MKEKEFIYGVRAILEAIEAGKTINKVLLQQGLQSDLMKELTFALKNVEIIPQKVPLQKLHKITRKNHQGAIAFISPVEYHSIFDLIPAVYEKGETPLLFILDRITDVRNLGSIARSAECNGVHGLIVPSRGSALINEDAVKTSAGALHKIPVCREDNLKETIDYLKNSGIRVVSCTEKTNNLLPSTNLNGPVAIIMGSEENGVSSEYQKMSDDKVKIPMFGSIESLNVAVSASIVMYEINRQRNA